MAKNEDDGRTLRAELLSALQSRADPKRAPGQQAYMKSIMPYLGVTVPNVRQIAKATFKQYPLSEPEPWQRCVLALWRAATHREVRYASIELLLYPRYRKWITFERMPLLRELIETGAWWDYVDGIAASGVGHVLAEQPEPTAALLREWALDDDLWIRRSAILAQLKFKEKTDFRLLSDCIEPSLDEPEFFLRKAIGWALREYSKTDPTAVERYVTAHQSRLAGLSTREALKIIKKSTAD